jgi:hypothetical protein
VLSAIQFNNQPVLKAHKVNYILPNRLLSPKFIYFELAQTEMSP